VYGGATAPSAVREHPDRLAMVRVGKIRVLILPSFMLGTQKSGDGGI
jgi:hypothetical protein